MKQNIKYLAFGIVGVFLLGVVLGGSEEPTATVKNKPTAAVQQQDSRTSVNKTVTVNGLEITITDIEIKESKILVGITSQNKSAAKLTFYPDQGSAVVGSMQLNANLLLTDGDTSGEIHPGVEKAGRLCFLAPEGKKLDPQQVSQVQLHLGDVFNDTTFKAQAVEIPLTRK